MVNDKARTEANRKRNYMLATTRRSHWRFTGEQAIEAKIITREQAAKIDDMLTREIDKYRPEPPRRPNPFN